MARVLVFDDKRPNALSMRRALAEAGFDVATASDVAKALVILGAGDVAVVICDQRNAGMSGSAFLDRCAVEHPAVVRILCAGFEDADAVRAAVAGGRIFQVIWNPWVPEDVVGAVRGAMTRFELDAAADADDFDDDEKTPTISLEAETEPLPESMSDPLAITVRIPVRSRVVSD